MAFRIGRHWAARHPPHTPPEAFLAELQLLQAALIRFNHAYRGEFQIPLRGGELTLLLEDDFEIVFDQLPGWLGQLAATEAPASLLFGSQGSEFVLHAERRGEVITQAAESLDPDRPLPATLQPLDVTAVEFFSAWTDFVLAVLDALADFEPGLRNDAGWRDYRAAMLAVRP
jgi:hypothetical protein